MKVLVTGLCTLHWGRLQYGNIGNYYIMEPLFRELHRVFPGDEIVTTFQMTNDFIEKEKVTVVPMELYYAWKEEDIPNAEKDYRSAINFSNKTEYENTEYIQLIRNCGLVINVSGDMWGDNAEHVGKSRFYVDLLKMRTAQLLGVKTVLFAGTPGPFTDDKTLNFAKEVYANFDLVINREPTSTQNMEKWGFKSTHVADYACPAFLYEPKISEKEQEEIERIMSCDEQGKLNIGFTIGGFNMPIGPYDMWPREDWQYTIWAECIEYIINKYHARVILISHTNGFELPPNFKLINGRDYPILSQLSDVVRKRGNISNENDLVCLDGPYLPNMTKKIIGSFDMMVAGRVHASVAAISQCVPTVFLTYEQSFIPSTKMYGFSSLAGVGELVCEPGNIEQIKEKIDYSFSNLSEIRTRLQTNIPLVKKKARLAFDDMKKMVE